MGQGRQRGRSPWYQVGDEGDRDLAYRKWSDSGSVPKGEHVGLSDRMGMRRRKRKGGLRALS